MPQKSGEEEEEGRSPGAIFLPPSVFREQFHKGGMSDDDDHAF